jgi:hypothetical protein
MMKPARDFDNILDECLERVLNKGKTIEQCLAGYSEYAVELEPMLRTALVAREASAIKPRPEFRERASYQFQAALREMEAKTGGGFFRWPRWATAAIVVVFLLLAGSGVVAAAGNSLPDEPLYQVKLATESVRLMLTPSALGKAELYVELTDRRVDEIIKLAEKGRVEPMAEAAERLDEYLIAMADLAVPGGGKLLESDIATFGAQTPGMPAENSAPAPTPAPTPAPAPVPLEEAPRALQKAPEPTESAEPAGSGGRGEEGVSPDEQAELRALLIQRAVENPEALRAALETVPESVRPALLQAIEDVGDAYERALSLLD